MKPLAERIAEITRIMVRGDWTRKRAVREALAHACGITLGTLNNDAAEASRRLKLDPAELDALRVENAQWLLALAERARRSLSNVTGLPDYRAAIEARVTASKYLGVFEDDRPVNSEARTVVEIKVTSEPADAPDPPSEPETPPT